MVLKSEEPYFSANFMLLETAKQICDALKEAYFGRGGGFQEE